MENRAGRVTADAAAALHDLLDAAGPAPAAGDPVPLLWHWLTFLPQSPHAWLGVDGHPQTGGFMPAMHGRRRMLAGARLDLPGQLRVEQPIHRTSQVTSVPEKHGRTRAPCNSSKSSTNSTPAPIQAPMPAARAW